MPHFVFFLKWNIDSKKIKTCANGIYADNWLITNPVNILSPENLNIFVDVEAKLTMCHDISKAASQTCYSNYFEVYIHRGIVDATKDNVFKKFSQSIYNITNHTSVNATLSRSYQTFSFSHTKPENVTFAVRSRGACGSIFGMKVYYFFCDDYFINGIKYKETVSPSKGYVKVVKGNCSKNTEIPSNGTVLRGNCRYNGSWDVGDNVTCKCVKNYVLDKSKGNCSGKLFCYEFFSTIM